jgi:hypothetical protein
MDSIEDCRVNSVYYELKAIGVWPDGHGLLP